MSGIVLSDFFDAYKAQSSSVVRCRDDKKAIGSPPLPDTTKNLFASHGNDQELGELSHWRTKLAKYIRIVASTCMHYRPTL
ncbi:hypothetical protein E1B28_013556 [Marasmius oreades]|uniref:Uncharacterized protein n=1 Tax=Marasmius oreades TaxID=181124 RepID=A0A9P7UMX5_9AGAR|nr:uncharacterized protein E1B28_013556 [Marasmius oreades]KAG7087603.1 hypothetical protein E1B28_013556 [Marasmius oreades]